MHPQWQQFLYTQRAIIDEHNVVVGFEAERTPPSKHPDDILCDLSGRGLISITGADALSFMQGQFTTNILDITRQQGQLSAWCSPKGRVLAVFTVVAHADGYLLMMPRELIATLLNRLRLYVLRAQVVVEDVSDNELVCIGCQGQTAETTLEPMFPEIPTELYQISHSIDGIMLIRVPGLSPRFELVGSATSMAALWTKLSSHLWPHPESTWLLGAMTAGVPNVRSDTADEYLPQMLNLELIGGVDFNKGCYPGQEIVARAHYLGKVKRRMYLIEIHADTPPSRGTPLIDATTGQTLGKIVEIIPKVDGDYLALAVNSVSCVDSGDVRLATQRGPTVQLSAFSYMESVV